jgi:phosphoenolpyruvate-protein kinase (PTS system EI component)
MSEVVATGIKTFDHDPVSGSWRLVAGPDDVLQLMDDGAAGVVAFVRDAGATFLAPIYDELTAIVCASGTPRSHLGIMSREFQVPCVMAAAFAGDEPDDGTTVEVDCSGESGIVRS